MKINTDNIREIQAAIWTTYGGDPEFRKLHHLREKFNGEDAWEATVAEFKTSGQSIYAFRMPDGRIACIAHRPPGVEGPADAVRAAIAMMDG